MTPDEMQKLRSLAAEDEMAGVAAGQIFFCGRGTGNRPLCPCGMRSVKRCTFELGGSKAGQTCRAPLCQKCAHPQGKGLAPGVCPAHAPAADNWDPTLVPRRAS